MNKYVSVYTNDKYQVGCTGSTIIVKQTKTKLEIDRIKFPYGYFGTLVSGQDIFIAKSTTRKNKDPHIKRNARWGICNMSLEKPIL